MTPYIILIIAIFCFRAFTLTLPEKKGNYIFLALTFIYLFIFCVIRSFDVGIDIPGYIRLYDLTKNIKWDDWGYVYFENGYIAFMKICNMIGLTSRGFFYIVYLIILLPVFIFIKRYSTRPFLSVILYIGFQFFTFDLTGLRQAMAMSIILLAYMEFFKSTKKSILKAVLIILLASTFHRSSLIVLPAFLIIYLPINKKTIILIIVAAISCVALNKVGIREVSALFKDPDSTFTPSTDSSQQLGLSLLLIIIFAACALYATKVLQKKPYQHSIFKVESKMAILLSAAICLMCLFNGSILLRSTMYYYIVFIVAIPIFVSCFDSYTRNIIATVLCILMLTNFFLNDLNSFNMLPYEIGREQTIFVWG